MKNRATRFRSCSTHSVLYLSNERTDSPKYSSTVVYEVEESDSFGNETVEDDF